MVENVHPADVSGLKIELDQALSTLDLALLEAGRSVAVVRNHMAQVVELAERSREMEAAMSRAREQLAVSFEDGAAVPPLRAVPAIGPVEAIDAPVMEPDAQLDEDSGEADPVEAEDPKPEETYPIQAPDPSAKTSRCLRLAVSSKSGNLDLKEVDSSVNENPSVIDVALLDYDGRQATLKLWINDAADPDGVRDALLTSLRNHLGKKDIELSIELEEDSSA
ncbi:MAG: hypothetical protein J4N95_00380 [Chloroflexi bacterium]|nr:hypothetical protein [Chloroflexota bacterium]MCI0855635.1 hypothetical protein [Chloroflexota bacterium]MCI0889403.1 hypothetical protein [Chloroflexota bacterium]